MAELTQRLKQLRPIDDGVSAELMQSRLRQKLWPSNPGKPIAIGRFVLNQEIGRGGLGVVYSAYDPKLDRQVALKVVATSSPHEQKRVLAEARALAKLAHAHVVAVYDADLSDESVCIAMELIDGPTLRSWVVQQKPSWRQIIQKVVEAGHGLSAAHRQGIAHGDFKPDNVLLGSDQRARVVDFGLARAMQSPEEISHGEIATPATNSLLLLDYTTTRKACGGTPAYMAPEQWQGQAANAQSDQFAFCMSLYELLTGQTPARSWTGNGPQLAAVPRGKVGRAPAWVGKILARGLSSAPKHRFSSMEEILQRLALGLGRARKWWIAGLVATGGLLTLGVTLGTTINRYSVPSRSEVCERSADRFNSVWNAERKALVQKQWSSVNATAVTKLGPQATQVMDEYQQQWMSSFKESCRATYERNEQSSEMFDKRMDCLRQRRSFADTMVTRWLEVKSPEQVEAISASLERFPEISHCNDVQSLAKIDAVPTDPQKSETLRQLDERFQKALVAWLVFDVDAAQSEVASLQKDAQVFDFAPLLARIGLLDLEMKMWLGEGDYETAINQLLVVSARAKTDTITAGVYLTWLYRLASENRIEKLKWLLPIAEQACLRADDKEKWADFLLGKSQYYLMIRDFANAVKFAKQCSDIYAEFLPDSSGRMGCVSGMANAYLQSGELPLALSTIDEVVAHERLNLGEENPTRGLGIERRAVILQNLGRHEESLVAYHEAEKLYVTGYGEDHVAVASVRINLASLLRKMGKTSAALSVANSALQWAKKNFQEADASLVPYLEIAGQAHVSAKDFTTAQKLFAKAAELLPNAPVEPRIQVLLSQIDLAQRMSHFTKARKMMANVDLLAQQIDKQDPNTREIFEQIAITREELLSAQR